MTKDSQSAALEKEIEKAAVDLGDLINRAPPKDREGLREFAHAMINQEVDLVIEEEPANATEKEASFNPLGLGLLFFVVGLGLSFLFGLVGALIAAIGLTITLWGLAQILFKKR